MNEDSSVQILAEEAHPVESLDSSACREILSSAQSQLSSASTDIVYNFFIMFFFIILNIFVTF